MLYDESFIDNIPMAQTSELRPLVNLKAHSPWLLIELNQWYDELLPSGDPELAGNLRNI